MKNKVLKISGLLLFIISLLFLFYVPWFEIKNEIYEENILEDFFESPNIISIPKIDNLTETENEKLEESIIGIPEETYIAILEIPKINLKRGLVSQQSRNNTIDKNIMIMPISTMPDIEKGNFVLAAHSGVGYLAFFKHLYKLNLEDLIIVYYNNLKYDYKIVDIYHEQKDGTVAIHKTVGDTTITLITCKYKDKTKHTIYVAKLNKTDNY